MSRNDQMSLLFDVTVISDLETTLLRVDRIKKSVNIATFSNQLRPITVRGP